MSFYIVSYYNRKNLDYLDGVHIVFGEMTGMDIIKKINETFVDKDFVPYQDVRYGYYFIIRMYYSVLICDVCQVMGMAYIGLVLDNSKM